MEGTMAYYLTYLYKDFLAYTTKELKDLGLNYGQLPFILYIGKHPDCTQAELTKVLQMDWGHSQRSITRLVEEGFLFKHHMENKDRKCHLLLTEKGERAFAVSHEVFTSWDQEQCKELDPEEKETLIRLLQKITSEKEGRKHETV